jgi:RNA polymerase sigma factor (sigma-70 family)
VGTASIPARLAVGPLSSRRVLALAADDTLVEQMRGGNEAAFTVAFERHARGLLSFCRHMVGSPEEAEDAVQHTFVSAFRHLQRPGEREIALKPWLYAIARNRCLSTLRSRREQTAFDFDLSTEGLTEEVERRAELRDLLRDLRELPDDQRAALLLSQAGNLSHAEVADVLGCETANVKALVFRARSGLIQRRDARETACEDIREQLANLHGNSLRRSALRHHLRSCAGCRDYREELKRQRGLLAAVLPVVPSLQLRSSVLAASGLGGGSLGGGLAAGLGTGLSASLGAGTVVKVAAVGLLVGGAAMSGDGLLAHAEGLLAPSREAAERAPASSSPKPSTERVVAGLPIGPRAVEGGPDTGVREQRSDGVPHSAAGPGDERAADQDGDGGSDPSAEGAPAHDGDQARGQGDDSDTVESAQGGRGETGAPHASPAPDRGPPAAKGGSPADKEGPPAHKGGSPAHKGGAPIARGGPPTAGGGPPADKGGAPADKGGPPTARGGPPSGTPDQAGPPSGTPGKVAQPPGAPATQGPPERSAPIQGTPEPRANSEAPPTIPDPRPVAAPKPVPRSQPEPAPRPADKPGGPG